MANQQGPLPPPEAPPALTFVGLFADMVDIYQGNYQPLLAAYAPNDQVPPLTVMETTMAQLPVDQVPSVFLYQDNTTTIRVVHHIHKVTTPLGQPETPLTNAYLGFGSDAYHGTALIIRVMENTFFSSTGDVVVPTDAALTAQLAAAPNGLVGPFNVGEPDTEVVNTRRAVPLPYAYIPLVAFRAFTPHQAWQQLGEQIILDGREGDCRILLNFLRVATVQVRGAIRNQPHAPPATCQPQPLAPVLDGPILEHTHRKLRQYLPAIAMPAPNAQGPQVAAALVNQTVAEGFEALRADRVLEREAAAIPKSFSEVFPAAAVGLRRLCLAGNDDELLPEYWQSFASLKGKKAAGLSTLIYHVTKRSNEHDSTGVLPIISTALYVNISAFELGASDLETITQGISPFLMCPTGHIKASDTTLLTQQYMLLQGEHNMPLLGDIKQLVPSNDYSVPDDFSSLTDFIGAYSVLGDVLIGPQHPLSVSIRNHHRFWINGIRIVKKAVPESYLRNVVIVGTLRSIQLAVLRYVNNIMYAINDNIPVPTFEDIEYAIHGRLFHNFPGLPAAYHQPKAKLPLPPPVAHAPTPPGGPSPPGNRPGTTGNQVMAPATERVQAFLDSFTASDKSIQQLRTVVKQPKTTSGSGTLCLSYHLRGMCFDSCRKKGTHKPLDPTEATNLRTFISTNL